MPEKNVHVVFGSGPLGLAVTHSLVGMGRQVRIVNRSGVANVPLEIEVTRAEASKIDEVTQACKDAEVVYQCAQPEYSEWHKLFPPLQAAILQGAAREGARFVAGDNLYMYGKVDGPITEDLPYRPNTRKGKLRAQMAQQIQDAHASGKIQAAIVRGSDFYGPFVLGSTLGERVFFAIVRGKTASVVGDPDVLHSYTYIEDFGAAMAIVGCDESAFGEVWHTPTAPAWTQRQLVEKAFEISGMPPKINATNAWMMRLGGLFIPEARESVEMMYEFEKPFFLDSAKFTQKFAKEATSHSVGLERTIRWYQELESRNNGKHG